MRQHIGTTVATYCLLALAGGFSFVLPSELGVQNLKAMPGGTPDTISLSGTLRDFRKTNTNFAATPSGGNGHYAGNVALSLGADSRPVYSGAGHKISTQWKDADVNPIAPHMYLSANAAISVYVVTSPTINNNPTVDTFNSSVGPYGGTNKGGAPLWVTGSTMPTITQPTGMPATSGDVVHSGNGTTTISADIYCKTYTAKNNRTVRISGHRRIVATDLFKIENHAKFEILPNSSLTVWTHKDLVLENNIDVNVNTHLPSNLVFNHTGTGDFKVENSARVYARVYAPNALFHIKNNADFMGSITSKSVQIDNGCGVHIDHGGLGMVCSAAVNDTVGTRGAASNGGMVSAARFADWFTDVPGTNLSMHYSIDLIHASGGVYEYLDDSFHPIDHVLFGNEGESHNNYFTYSIEVPFVHHACADKFFEFQGCDDAWLYVDGDLGMDLGGIIPGTRQYVDMDRFGLTDGQTYTLHFFYAQRQGNFGIFRLRTNVDLMSTPKTYAITGVGD